jgi:hypothetical protein
LYEALTAANNALTTASPLLRTAIGTAALGVVIKEATRIIEKFKE